MIDASVVVLAARRRSHIISGLHTLAKMLAQQRSAGDDTND